MAGVLKISLLIRGFELRVNLGNYSILGQYWENGKENGNCYSILGLYRDYMLD